MKRTLTILCTLLVTATMWAGSWIRTNQLGYLPKATKVAVLLCNDATDVKSFEVIDAFTGKVALTSHEVVATAPYGKMKATFRLNFSKLTAPGTYYIKAGNARSEVFPVNGTVYNGTADYVLRYMRQQRCGYNPFLKDS